MEDFKSLPNSENDIPKENTDRLRLEDVGDGIDDLDSPLTSPSKISHHSAEKSLKKNFNDEEEEEQSQEGEKQSEGSDGGSVKQTLLNELKINLLAPFQSIYQKEDNLRMDSDFYSLNRVKWFLRILFFTILPMNISLYFAGANVSFGKLSQSIKDIYLNEDLRKDYTRAHDAMITFMLDNQGAFDSNTTAVTDAELEALRGHNNRTLKAAYENILVGNDENEWTSILYKYLPAVQSTTSVNYQGVFGNIVIDTENSLQKLTNSLADIYLLEKSEFVASNSELQFYRMNSLQKFNVFLSSVTSEIFESLQDNFDKTSTLSTVMLIIEVFLFLLSFVAIVRLIFVVIRNLKEILTTFTYIENKHLREAQKYFRRLGGYLEASVAIYINDNVGNEFFDKVAYEAPPKPVVDQNTRYKKVFKNIKSGDFMKNTQMKIFGYYSLAVLFSIGLTVIFHVMIIRSLNQMQTVLNDSQAFLQLNPAYIVSIIGLKELHHDKSFYKQYDLPYMKNIITQLENNLDTSLFETDLRWIKFLNNIMNGNPCEYMRQSMDLDQYSDCNTLGLQRLSSGLVSFHNFYGDYILNSLKMNDQTGFGNVDAKTIYEFGQLIQIIDTIFMEKTLKYWREDMNSYLSAKENLIIILLVMVCVLNIVVFAGAQMGIVGTLNKSFLLYRKIFNKYMLGEALNREKRIKSRLVKYKLLNK